MAEDARVSLELEELVCLVEWSLPFVVSALPLFTAWSQDDARPAQAIEGMQEFIATRRRTAAMRAQAWGALKAAQEAESPAAEAAARSTGLGVSTAYTHALAKATQSWHTLGPIAYAAWAIELDTGDRSRADTLVAEAIATSTPTVVDVVCRYPAFPESERRIVSLMVALDRGLRSVR